MLPEVETYTIALRACRRKYSQRYGFEIGKLNQHPHGTPEWHAARTVWIKDTEVRDADQVAEEQALRAELGKSADPLVAWIATHAMPNHDDEAEVVLQALPATVAELHELADEQDWCDTFDAYLQKAIKAGVISDARRPLSAAEQELTDWVGSQEYPSSREFANLLRDVVDAAVQAALENAGQTH